MLTSYNINSSTQQLFHEIFLTFIALFLTFRANAGPTKRMDTAEKGKILLCDACIGVNMEFFVLKDMTCSRLIDNLPETNQEECSRS